MSGLQKVLKDIIHYYHTRIEKNDKQKKKIAVFRFHARRIAHIKGKNLDIVQYVLDKVSYVEDTRTMHKVVCDFEYTLLCNKHGWVE